MQRLPLLGSIPPTHAPDAGGNVVIVQFDQSPEASTDRLVQKMH